MSKDSEPPPPPTPGGQFLVYQTQDGKLKIDVRFEGETVWLTQQHMAELFHTTKQNIGQHLKSIFAEAELVQDSVVNRDLIQSPFTIIHPSGIRGVFSPAQITEILALTNRLAA